MLKYIGSAYLVYLGIKLWRVPVVDPALPSNDTGESAGSSFSIFLHTYIVTALNPKSIIFFVAFLPQFLDLSQPYAFQMVVFEITFLVLAITNASLYGLMASMARETIRKPRMQKIVNRTGGGLLMAAGAFAPWLIACLMPPNTHHPISNETPCASGKARE